MVKLQTYLSLPFETEEAASETPEVSVTEDVLCDFVTHVWSWNGLRFAMSDGCCAMLLFVFDV